MRIDYTPGNIFESFYISLTRKELDKHLDNPSMFIDGSLTISLGQLEPEVFKQLLKSVTERLPLLFSLDQVFEVLVKLLGWDRHSAGEHLGHDVPR
jgi:hypothetical protein